MRSALLALLTAVGIACSHAIGSGSTFRPDAKAADGMLVRPINAPLCPDTAAREGPVFSEDSVDVAAMKVVHVAPLYPVALRDAFITAEITVEFVINIAGCAQAGSIRATSATRQEFVPAVLAALRRTGFEPARHGGIRVPQMANQLYTFSLNY